MRTPWVVGLPILLDLFLWRGPQVSLAPLVEWLLSTAQRGLASRVLGELGVPPPEAQDALREALVQFNVFSTLAFNIVALPTSAPTRSSLGPIVATLDHPLSAAIAFLGLEGIGMALGCVFLAGLAQRVRSGSVSVADLVRSIPRVWSRFALLVLAVIALPVIVGLPVGLVLAIVALLSPLAAQVVGTILIVAAQVAIVWLAIYLFFVIDAVVVSDLSARAAVEASVHVVSRNFWAALGLIILSFVIAQGMFQIWAMLSRSDLGSVVAIVGHAFVASGLTAASMVFYWNRVQHEQEA